MPTTQQATAVVGLQWGDEGKGKVVDLLAADHDAVIRYNGGANAGHSVVVGKDRYALHLVPSGILYPGTLAIIGNGVVVDPAQLLRELDDLSARGVDTAGLIVSSRAHVVMPYHKHEDAAREEVLRSGQAATHAGERVLRVGQIGTTKRGIGPAYADKCQRASAIRMGDLLRPDTLLSKLEVACLFKNALLGDQPDTGAPYDPNALADQLQTMGQRLAPMIRDTTYLLHDMLADGKRLLFEGGNATLLDVDHGTYPFVTSSVCSALGIGPGSGVPTTRMERVLGIAKVYCTRVGAGPMPTELNNETGELIRKRGNEFGTTTGRPRRTGWLDLVALRYAAMVNGATALGLSMLDVLAGFDELKVCIAYDTPKGRTDRFLPDAYDLMRATPVYETLPGFAQDITHARTRSELPANANAFVAYIEQAIGLPAQLIGVGPDRAQTILS